MKERITLVIDWYNQTSTVITWSLIGVLLGVGFIIPYLWVAVCPGVILFFHKAVTTSHLRSVMLGGFVAGSIKSLCAIVWFWDVFPFDAWLSVGGWFGQVSIIGISWLVSGLSLGSSGIIIALCLFTLKKYAPVPLWLIACCAPVVWLVAEILGSVVFSLTTSGPGSFVQSYFSFGYSGYLLGLTELGVFIAYLGGVYTLTLLVVGWNIALYFVPRRWQMQFIGVTVILFAIFQYLPASHALPLSEAVPITIAAIDTTFDAVTILADDGYELKANALNEAMTAAMALNPMYVVLPEDSRYLDLVYPRQTIKQSFATYQFGHSTSSTLVVDSGRTELPSGKLVQRARVFSGTAGYVAEFDKQYLVPQGEFIPYAFRLMLKFSGASLSVLSRPSVGRYEPGPLQQSGDISESIPAILFCFESARPDGVSSLLNNRSQPVFIAHPVSHAWFHSPHLLWVQLEVMLRLQSRSTHMPIVSAGNMTSGKTYEPNGEVRHEPVVASGTYWSVRFITL